MTHTKGVWKSLRVSCRNPPVYHTCPFPIGCVPPANILHTDPARSPKQISQVPEKNRLCAAGRTDSSSNVPIHGVKPIMVLFKYCVGIFGMFYPCVCVYNVRMCAARRKSGSSKGVLNRCPKGFSC